jgi:hypothetical protein
MLNVNELQIVNDFLTAVAPKLQNNTNVVLNENEIVLAINGITLLAREQAAKKGIAFQVEFNAAFAEMFKHIDTATKQAISEQLSMLDPTKPGTLRIVADAIVNAFCIAGRSIGHAIAFAFNHVVAFVKAVWNWTVEKATMIYNYLCAKGSEAYTWLRDTAAPFVGNKIVQAYDWSLGAVKNVAQFGWSLLCKGFDLVMAAFKAVLSAIGSVINAVDQKLGEWFTPSIIKQAVMLTAPCKITLPCTVIANLVGYTYVSVVLATSAHLALLKAEIAGRGVLV